MTLNVSPLRVTVSPRSFSRVVWKSLTASSPRTITFSRCSMSTGPKMRPVST